MGVGGVALELMKYETLLIFQVKKKTKQTNEVQ